MSIFDRQTLRHDTEPQWQGVDPPLAMAEPVISVDANGQPIRLKIGGGPIGAAGNPKYSELTPVGGDTPRPLQRGVFVYDYEPGTYGEGLVVVAFQGDQYQLLAEQERPFTSTDLIAELRYGKWKKYGGDVSPFVRGNGIGSVQLAPDTTVGTAGGAANNYGSLALGENSFASGMSGVSLGYGTDASGNYSLAQNYQNKAAGESASASGSYSKAIGGDSSAAGYQGNSQAENEHTIGAGSFPDSQLYGEAVHFRRLLTGMLNADFRGGVAGADGVMRDELCSRSRTGVTAGISTNGFFGGAYFTVRMLCVYPAPHSKACWDFDILLAGSTYGGFLLNGAYHGVGETVTLRPNANFGFIKEGFTVDQIYDSLNDGGNFLPLLELRLENDTLSFVATHKPGTLVGDYNGGFRFLADVSGIRLDYNPGSQS